MLHAYLYLQQFLRAVRYLDELERPSADEWERRDRLITFAMHCWHLKDHVESDYAIPEDIRARIVAAARGSPVLEGWRHVANGSKHLSRKPTRVSENTLTRFIIGQPGSAVSVPLVTMPDGSDREAIPFAHEALAEWRRILSGEGLSLDPADADPYNPPSRRAPWPPRAPDAAPSAESGDAET